jgi:putative sigma-54 modulation protein
MEMQIQARNTRLSDGTRDYLTKKLERIEGRLKFPVDAHVVVSEEKTRSHQDRFVVEVTLRCNGTLLRGQERAVSVQAAVDSLSTKLDRRVAQFKSKFYRSAAAKRTSEPKSIREIEAPEPDDSEEEDEDEVAMGRVVRSKQFAMKPMSVEEAAIQMEMLDHAFFLFENAGTGVHNVLYRRSDGDYGLIEPEKS